MKKKIITALLVLCLVFTLTGCEKGTVVIANTAGIGRGAVGDVFRTGSLDVTVLSVQNVASYGGYTPLKGQKLVDVVIKVTNISDRAVTLYDTDFQLQWGSDGFTDPLINADSQTMAPLEFTLKPGEKAEYHYIYSVLKQITHFSLVFTGTSVIEEQDAAIYYVDFSL